MPTVQELQNQKILDFAMTHFSSQTHEYGREDMAGVIANRRTGERIDPTRFNQDMDHDGRKGVDCSSMVYYSLQGAGFDLNKTASQFTTSTLFNGSQVTEYAKTHFDVLPPSSKTDQSLKPGDLIMLRMPSGSQHVAIFKGYDDQGRIQFFGSQTSTGPATVTLNGNTYWDERSTYYGALRPKENFIKPEHKIQSEPDKHLPQTSMSSQQTDAGLTLKDLSERHQILIAQAHEHVHRLYQMHGMPIDQGTQNTVFSVAAVAAERGMTRIEHATVKEGQINLLQMNGMVAHAATIDGNVAANTAAEQSLNRLAELERNQAHSMHHPTQQMEHPHPVRSIT